MKNINKRQIYLTGVLAISMVLISLIFHYDIRIIDAFTLDSIPDYNIHISIWRIIFEPIIGILLFFNRSLFAISELIYLLIWILIIYAAYSTYRVIKNDKLSRKKIILNKIAYIPIVIGLWFTFFAIVIFIPLPNNTIINNSPNSILVSTHAHTKYSHDGLISQTGMWKWHKRNGFDAFFITDHNNHNKTLDFIKSQQNNDFSIDPLIMAGEEFSGKNHLSLLGLKRKFSTRGLSLEAVVDSVRANKGVILANHWFDGEKMSLESLKKLGIDGFEIENTGTGKTYDRKVYQRLKTFVVNNNLIMHGGLDFHGYGGVCSIWNAFEIPNWHKMDILLKEESILSILRNHEQEKLKVLLYHDRPYYTSNDLIFRPFFTLFNYLRTLNIYQVSSWIIWIFLFALIRIKITNNRDRIEKRINISPIIVISYLSAIFMLVLGTYYFMKIENVTGFSEVFEEYSTLLFYIGSTFFLYTSLVTYFKIRKKKSN